MVRSRRGSASPTAQPTDHLTELALAGGQGDQAAISALVNHCMDDVWQYCAASIGPLRADDATQETFIRAVKSLPRFRGDASARTWLLKIARFVCIDDMRARSRHQRIVDKLSAQPLNDEALADRHPPELTEILELLGPDQREAFVLTQILGLPYQEAAELAGCPIGTIRSRVARARASLIELLDETDDTAEAEIGV